MTLGAKLWGGKVDRYFNRVSSLAGLREIAADAGHDLGAAMHLVGLDHGLLHRPEERVTFETFCALLEHCAESWAMPDLGLRMAPYQHLDILGPVALVTRMEHDLRGAINAIINNLVIHSNALIAALEEDGVATVTLDSQSAPAGTRQYMLLAMGACRNVLEQAASAKISFIEVTFRHDMLGMQTAVSAYFRCPVRFGAERNALSFDSVLLDRTVEQSDTAYHAIIERYLTTAQNEVAGRMRDTVSAEIARQMEFGACSLESVAQRLRIEPRSMQRRLRREGFAFRGLVDEWRRVRALSLIAHTWLPLSEVSLALGYSDQSIFSRAFRRWYGETPLVYRNKNTANGAPS